MTKVRAASFGLDIAGLLAEESKKSSKSVYQNIIDKYKEQVSKNNDMIKNMEALKQANETMWKRAVPDKINNLFSEALKEIPSSSVYYTDTGEFPDHPSEGDIDWQSGAWKDIGSNTLEAKAYRFSRSAGWTEIKGANQDLYGSNIFGANIKGGMITAVDFRSNEQGVNGAPFSVDRDGNIYAQNLTMDLRRIPTSDPELNKVAYNGDSNNAVAEGGLSFNNGLMHMQGDVKQLTGTRIRSPYLDNEKASEFYGETFIEPDYLKLRTIPYDDVFDTPSETELLGRTDIRGGNLEISDKWEQNSGVRLGYWIDKYGDEGPMITIGKFDEYTATSRMDEDNLVSKNILAVNKLSVGEDMDIIKSDNGHVHIRSDKAIDFYKGHWETVRAGNFISKGNSIASDLSIKKDISSVSSTDALAKVLNTDIKSWQYKDNNNNIQRNIGPIIDDLNTNKTLQYYIPNDLVRTSNDGNSFILNNAISFLFLSIQELQKQNTTQLIRISKLERKIQNEQHSNH